MDLAQLQITDTLCEIYAEVLGVESVNADDHFFNLGGHSLVAMQAAVRMEERLGVETPVSLIFEHPTVRELASALANRPTSARSRVVASGGPETVASGFSRTPKLAPAERAMWFLDQAIGRRAAYLLSDAWELEGSLDVEALRGAFETIVARHPVLSARYEIVSGEPRVTEHASEPFALDLRDLRGMPAADQDAAAATLILDATERPFDLQRDCLLRARLLRLADKRHLLLLTLHHIASDASSQRLLRQELGAHYAARLRGRATAASAPAPTDAWRPAPVAAARMSTLRSYWTLQLAGLPLLEMPADRRRLSAWSDDGAELTFDVPVSLTDQLRQLASDHGLTLQMLLLTAYAVLLGRYSGQSDFGIATFASDRRDPRLERAIGLFVNTIVLRVDLSGTPTLPTLMGRMRRTSLDAYDHRDYPFDALVSELRPDRMSGPNPLTPVAFQFLPIADDPPTLEGLTVRSRPCPARHIRFDLEFTIRQEATGLRALVGYSTDLFDHETIGRLAGHYRTLLESMVAAPGAAITDLPLLSDADRHEQLHAWSGAGINGTRAVVIAMFEAQVARSPHAPVMTRGERRLTYAELASWADRIAADISAAGVGTGDIVAIYAERSMALIAATVGTLKAGAAYMPLDPSHPDERLAFMMRDAHSATLLADAEVPGTLRDQATTIVRISRDAPGGATTSDRPRPAVTADSLAYVMYTSGSTGQPKGVAVAQRGITRLVCDTNYVRFGSDDVVAFVSNPAFDAATFEIWGALLSGARLVLFERDTILSPQRFGAGLKAEGVTVMFLTAALFRQIVATAPAIFGSLRYLIVGGDVVDPAAASEVLRAAPPEHLVNGYGPTENTTFSATFAITSALGGARSIPIGRPIAGSTCYVLDERLALLPVGAVGELYVGGAGISLGYINQPALTRERFVEHPFAATERLYRTGDRVRWRADGQLEFLGRIDRQVKLRGHRIELEEIEHVLARHPAVTMCAVTTDLRQSGERRLVAYAACAAEPRPSVETLRRYLQEQLPAFMVPDIVIALDALPLTPNGKVDRAALSPPTTVRLADAPASAAPSTPSALAIGKMFARVLEREDVPNDESFFDLGGDSFGALQLATALSTGLGRSVPVSMVFEHPTVARLAAALAAEIGATLPHSIVEVRRGGTQAPLYFPPGVLGEVMLGDAFLEELPADVPLYALRDLADAGTRAPSMEAMAARFCAEITAFQPEGPLSLAGYSFGGLLAYEMARQLRAAGREIAMLAIFDTGPDFSKGGSLKDIATRVGLCLENLPRWIAEDVIHSLGRETPARLWRSVRKLVRSIVTRDDTAAATPGSFARVEHLFDVSGWSPALFAHVENNLRIIGSFRFGPYDGQVTLFRARVRPLFHAHTWDLGWQAVARSVRVIEAPGNHHTLMHDHIRVLARLLRGALDEG